MKYKYEKVFYSSQQFLLRNGISIVSAVTAGMHGHGCASNQVLDDGWYHWSD